MDILCNNPGLNEVTLKADGGWIPVQDQPVQAIDLDNSAAPPIDQGQGAAAQAINLDQEVADIDVKEEVVILDDNKKRKASGSKCEKATESLSKRSCPSLDIRKAFKLCNRFKIAKKMVVTTGVADLIQKGKQRFGYPESQNVKVLMEDDTEIEDDESLLDLDRHTVLVLAYTEDNYRIF